MDPNVHRLPPTSPPSWAWDYYAQRKELEEKRQQERDQRLLKEMSRIAQDTVKRSMPVAPKASPSPAPPTKKAKEDTPPVLMPKTTFVVTTSRGSVRFDGAYGQSLNSALDASVKSFKLALLSEASAKPVEMAKEPEKKEKKDKKDPPGGGSTSNSKKAALNTPKPVDRNIPEVEVKDPKETGDEPDERTQETQLHSE